MYERSVLNIKYRMCSACVSLRQCSQFVSLLMNRCLTIPNKRPCHSFVPQHNPVVENDVVKLKNFIRESAKLLVLTGAGISTESGMPDYRSENVGLYARNKTKPYTPIQYQEFVKNSAKREKFWIRNFMGWEKTNKFKPNITHLVLRRLEVLNKILFIVTQNVDRLHIKANSVNVIELHGSVYNVICLNCDYSIDRNLFQITLDRHNPDIFVKATTINPDGDVELDKDQSFFVPVCPKCGGLLKPDIVFFGENVPKERAQLVDSLIEQCDSLLVLGSTLTVHSSYRIVSKCHTLKKPIAIVNIGLTRADNLSSLKIETRCGAILSKVLEEFDL